MSDFKPTTEQIRSGYMYDGGEAEYHDPINGHLQYKQAGKWFDHWLTVHDAEVRAVALEEAENAVAASDSYAGKVGEWMGHVLYTAETIRHVAAIRALTPPPEQEATK